MQKSSSSRRTGLSKKKKNLPSLNSQKQVNFDSRVIPELLPNSWPIPHFYFLVDPKAITIDLGNASGSCADR